MGEPESDGLYQQAQTRATPLLSKLADLTENEWDELTYRWRELIGRELDRRGLTIVPATEPVQQGHFMGGPRSDNHGRGCDGAQHSGRTCPEHMRLPAEMFQLRLAVTAYHPEPRGPAPVKPAVQFKRRA